MRRYKFLTKADIFEALNKLSDAFLAAKDGNEVEEIIMGLLTYDEKMKIGRRILVAEAIKEGLSFDKISKILKVGRSTIVSVMKTLDEHPGFLDLILKRAQKVEKDYKNKKYRSIGGSKLIHENKEYTGFKRRDVKR